MGALRRVDKRRSGGYNTHWLMATVTLYSRPGCHLCEDALSALRRVQKLQPFVLEQVDIDNDLLLIVKYGERIPVVLLDGLLLFEYQVDEAQLCALLKGVK